MAGPEANKTAGISSGAVAAGTGKGWDEWFRILDAEGAAALPHKRIAGLLHSKHKLPGWWAQMVTVGYEQARGLRAVHQKPDGFAASSSKTVPVPVSELYRHFHDARLRSKWMGQVKLTVRKATENRSMRVTCEDGAGVDIYFWAKGEAKSSVQIQHNKLQDEADVQRRKAFWKEALERLSATLAG
jgi:hypothetical protein